MTVWSGAKRNPCFSTCTHCAPFRLRPSIGGRCTRGGNHRAPLQPSVPTHPPPEKPCTARPCTTRAHGVGQCSSRAAGPLSPPMVFTVLWFLHRDHGSYVILIWFPSLSALRHHVGGCCRSPVSVRSRSMIGACYVLDPMDLWNRNDSKWRQATTNRCICTRCSKIVSTRLRISNQVSVRDTYGHRRFYVFEQ